MTPSRYQDLLGNTMPRVHAPGVVIDVDAGIIDGVTGTALTHQSVQGLAATLEPLATYELAVPAQHRLFAHVTDGDLLIGGRELRAGQVGWSDPLPNRARTSPVRRQRRCTSPPSTPTAPPRS